MTPREIRDFQSRDWRLKERSKLDFWTGKKATMSPTEVFQLASELFAHARALKPDWPDSAEREADLASHVRLAGMLRRATPNRRCGCNYPPPA